MDEQDKVVRLPMQDRRALPSLLGLLSRLTGVTHGEASCLCGLAGVVDGNAFCPCGLTGVVDGMEDEADSANDMGEQEESTGSVPGPSFSGRNLKRFWSKVWGDFTPIFVGAKVARAECMHCHQVYNVGSSGTSNLLKHQAKCSTRTQERPTQEKIRVLPSTQKSTIAASSGLTQKKLLFSVTSQKKCLGTADAALEKKGLALLGIPNGMNKKNQEVNPQEELATNEQKILTSGDTPVDKDQNTKSHEEFAVPEQDIPTNMNQKIAEADQGKPHEELFRIFSEHGHPPLIRVHDRFTKFVACLDPMVKLPAEFDMYGYSWRLFDKEKAKLKEKFAALSTRKNIIKFEAVDPSCNAKELSQSILYDIEDWGLCDKIFGIILVFNELKKMQKKFKEHWKLCCVHICMPMIMDPSYRLKRIKSHLWSDAGNYHPGKRRFDDDIEDYIEQVHGILLDVFYEYSDQVEDTSCIYGSKTSTRSIAKGRDTLMDYYQCDKYLWFEQPMTELDQYMQEPSSLSTGESGVLQWWKEHELTFPIIARMARDILAMPLTTDYSVATRTARRAFCDSSERWIEHVVCIQDWLRSDGSASE
ncbi:hypothetical protein ACQ4PT_007890 [Festuca glaucescens]